MDEYVIMEESFELAESKYHRDFYDLSDEEQSKIMDEAYENIISAEAGMAESLCGGDR